MLELAILMTRVVVPLSYEVLVTTYALYFYTN